MSTIITTTTGNTAAQSLNQAVRDAFPFTVERFPLAGPDGMGTPWYGLFRSDNGQAVGPGSVTGRYVPHTLEDVSALVDAAGVAFEGCTLKGHFDHGHHVVIQPTKEQRLAVYGTDTVWPRMIIDAPYGGGGSFRASLGMYRDACKNLAILRQVSGVTVTIRHTRGLRDRMSDLIEQFSTLRGRWDSVTETIRAMEYQRVDLPAFLDSIYGAPEPTPRSRTTHRHRTAAIMSRIIRERAATGRDAGQMEGRSFFVTGWEAYNSVQGYTQHDARRHGRPSPLERAIAALDSADVARAEEIVLAL
jgi:hypothetical protein